MFVGAIPVRVNPFFLLLILAIGWLNSFSVPGTMIWMIVIFVSVLVHELGHALTAQYFGQKAEIELFALGGVTRRRGPPLTLWKEFFIVLNGPLAGIAIFVLAYQAEKFLAGRPAPILLYTVHITWVVNLFWTFLNLLPIQPLDGGHLLRILLEGIFGIRGVKISLFIGMVFSGIFSLLCFLLGQFIIGALFFMFTFENYRGWKDSLSFKRADQNTAFQKMLKEADHKIRSGNLGAAETLLQKVRDGAKTGVLFLTASEYMAQIKTSLGQQREAYNLLYPIKDKLSESSLLLLHQLAYQLGHIEEAIDLGNRAFQSYPTPKIALINACCHALLGQAHPAVGWLQTAVSEGLTDVENILKKQEFNHIRDTAEFRAFLQKLP